MFGQMVKDMQVPPEIFCELTDEQKYVLHYEIRQEQIRRYNEWQRSTDNVGNASKPKHKLKFSLKKKKVKHVNFIEGLDGKLQVQQIYLDPDNMVNDHATNINFNDSRTAPNRGLKLHDDSASGVIPHHVACNEKKTTIEPTKLILPLNRSLHTSDASVGVTPKDWPYRLSGEPNPREYTCKLRRGTRVEQHPTTSVKDSRTSTLSINLQTLGRPAEEGRERDADPFSADTTHKFEPIAVTKLSNEKPSTLFAPNYLSSCSTPGKYEFSRNLDRTCPTGQFLEFTTPVHSSKLLANFRGTSSIDEHNELFTDSRTDDSSGSDSDASLRPRGRGFQRLFVVNCSTPSADTVTLSNRPQTCCVTFITTRPRFTSPAENSPGNTLTTDQTDSVPVVGSHLPRTVLAIDRCEREGSTATDKTSSFTYSLSPCTTSKVSADIRRRQEELFHLMNPGVQEPTESIWFFASERPHLMREFCLPSSCVDWANRSHHLLNVPKWFHGPMSKFTAEDLLRREGQNGAYLVRVSSTFCGYVISWLWNDQCHHQLVSVIHPSHHTCTSGSQRSTLNGPSYQLYPQSNTNHFGSLKELILFYSANSLTYPERQYLLYAVGQQLGKNGLPDYMDLFYPRSVPNRDIRL